VTPPKRAMNRRTATGIRAILDDVIRIACEAVDEIDKANDAMLINCTDKAADLNDRLEDALEAADKHLGNGAYQAFFSKRN